MNPNTIGAFNSYIVVTMFGRGVAQSVREFASHAESLVFEFRPRQV